MAANGLQAAACCLFKKRACRAVLACRATVKRRQVATKARPKESRFEGFKGSDLILDGRPFLLPCSTTPALSRWKLFPRFPLDATAPA
jgi:hypothetical protein